MYKGKKLEESSIIQKSFSTSLLTEAPTQTFEREIDNYTRLLEQDKRKFFRVQENRNEAVKEFSKRSKELEALKGKQFSSQMVKMKGKIKILENELDKTINSYNDVLSSNKKLKVQIDELRKKKMNQKEVMDKINSKIEEYSQVIAQEKALAVQRQSHIEQDKQGILAIKAQNQLQARAFKEEIVGGKQTLNGSKASNQLLKRRVEVEPKNQSIDNLPFVRYRLRHLITRNRERVKVIQSYKKTMKAIWQGFEDIKEESGINDIEQITSAFLKYEQQNHFIYQYIGKLNRQIQDLNEEIESLKERVSNQKDLNQEYMEDLGATPKKEKIRIAREKHEQECQEQIKTLEQFLKIASVELKELDVAEDVTRFNLTQGFARLEQMIDQNFAVGEETGNPNIFIEDMTRYTKGPPNYGEEVKENRDEKLMDVQKLREFASDFWEKRKAKGAIS